MTSKGQEIINISMFARDKLDLSSIIIIGIPKDSNDVMSSSIISSREDLIKTIFIINQMVNNEIKELSDNIITNEEVRINPETGEEICP